MKTASDAPVNTGKVSGRRTLQFAAIPEIVSDVDMLTARGYRQLGNWSLGQISLHLAEAMSFAVEDAKFNVPWVLRFAATKVFKKQILRGPMKAGFKLPKGAAKVLVPAPISDVDGVAAIRSMMTRWQAEPLAHKHPFFGSLTPDEWHSLTCRHSEMHLSFLVPK